MIPADLFTSDVEETVESFVLEKVNGDKVSIKVLRVHEENQNIDIFVSRVIWPSSFFLARLFAQTPLIVEDKQVIELGAGAGLTGLTVSLLEAKNVVLSDGCQHSINVLNRSVELNKIPAEHCKVKTLEWTNNIDSLESLGKFDVVVAADVVYESESVKPLLATAKALLKHPHSKFYLANHKHRFDLCVQAFQIAVEELGLRAELQPTPKFIQVDSEDGDIKFYIISKA